MDEGSRQSRMPHVLVFPFPAQGHINSMLKLSQLLCLSGLNVTFLNSEHNHDRLLRHGNLHDYFRGWSRFRFLTISDGLPPDHPRSMDRLMDLFDALKTRTTPLLRRMLVDDRESPNAVTCIICDGIMLFMIDVGRELEIPVIAFRTISACSFWAYFCIPRLIEAGELPFPDDADMNEMIKSIPVMESFLRRRDLPSFLRAKQLSDPTIQLVMSETRRTCHASALILNTFETLESPVLSQIRVHCPTTYALGPLHALLRVKLADSPHARSASSSLWSEDEACLRWLDLQRPKSVLYVSFGSFTVLTRDELMEFWYGLVNSGKPFLWVIRPDLINGDRDVGLTPPELASATKERGLLVSWAPQEEVLFHSSVGGFLTHSGWNSTVESLFAGVPMLCWPFFADQQINSRFVSQVWKVGLDMKDRCDRKTVEEKVNELMDHKCETLRNESRKMARLAKESVSPGGSSHVSLERLVDRIKSLSSLPPTHG